MRVDVSARRWRLMCVFIVGVKRFARRDFARVCLTVVRKVRSVLSDGVTLVAYIGVCISGRCTRCAIDRYCIPYAILIDGQRMPLDANEGK